MDGGWGRESAQDSNVNFNTTEVEDKVIDEDLLSYASGYRYCPLHIQVEALRRGKPGRLQSCRLTRNTLTIPRTEGLLGWEPAPHTTDPGDSPVTKLTRAITESSQDPCISVSTRSS